MLVLAGPGNGRRSAFALPDWVPDYVRRYLDHTNNGVSIRELARIYGCAPSTVLRQIRRAELRRDDPLIDTALNRLSKIFAPSEQKDRQDMTARPEFLEVDDDNRLIVEAKRVLRRLCERNTILAVSADLDQAAVLRIKGETPERIAVVDRRYAEAFALKDWISSKRKGRVAQYEITSAGRAALKQLFSSDATPEATRTAQGFAERPAMWDRREPEPVCASQHVRRVRCNLAESPLSALARRKDRDGQLFLTREMVAAGERLREDFELAQVGTQVTQNWDRFLTDEDGGGFRNGDGFSQGPSAAKERVRKALDFMGPGLSDVALRCCCLLEGLETAERRMGWSARSGKIVLRIALQRLARHYQQVHGQEGDLIG